MVTVLCFLVGAVSSFALSLVVAALTGPDGFGAYAIGLAVAAALNALLFEPLRLCTLRFDATNDASAARSTLTVAYRAAACLVAAGAILVWGLGGAGGHSGRLLAAALASALATGLFERHVALARTRDDDGAYVVLVGIRSVGGFALAAGAAFLAGDPAAVLVASAAAAALAVLVEGRRRVDAAALRTGGTRRMALRFVRYAGPLVAGGAIVAALPVLARSVLAERAGLAEAGYLSLSSEIATRLFQNLGAALDLALFPLMIGADARHGRKAAEARALRNAAIVTAIVCPAAAGLWLVWPSFEVVLIPPEFRGRVASSAAFMIPALALFALTVFALAPLFQLRERTAPVVAAAVATIGTATLLLVVARPTDAAGVAAAQLAGFAAGFATLVTAALVAGFALPWRDGAATLAATGAMTALLLPWREAAPGPGALAAAVLAGGLAYAGLALAFDIAGCRPVLARLIGTARRYPSG